MKTIIAGSRSLKNPKLIQLAVDFSGFRDIISEVVSGCAPGIDTLAIWWAIRNGFRDKIRKMPADWDNCDGLPACQIGRTRQGKPYNKAAGYERNQAMADYVGPTGGLIAIWDGKSGGTTDMIERAEKKGMKISVYEV